MDGSTRTFCPPCRRLPSRRPNDDIADVDVIADAPDWSVAFRHRAVVSMHDIPVRHWSIMLILLLTTNHVLIFYYMLTLLLLFILLFTI